MIWIGLAVAILIVAVLIYANRPQDPRRTLRKVAYAWGHAVGSYLNEAEWCGLGTEERQRCVEELVAMRLGDPIVWDRWPTRDEMRAMLGDPRNAAADLKITARLTAMLKP